MPQQLESIDAAATNFILDLVPRSGFFTIVFEFFSARAPYRIWWVFIIILVLILHKKRWRKVALDTTGATAIAFIINEYLLKNILGRTRPTRIFEELVESCPLDFSLPSSHAAVAFASAAILARYDRRHSPVYYTIASLVAFSRVYLGCHFVLDVMLGGLIGLAVSKLYLKLKSPRR